MNPYLIDRPASIGFSGGRTSALMLYRILEAYGGSLPEDVKVNFENTGDEWEATLVFVEEVSRRWGVKVNWLEWDDKFTMSNYVKKDGTRRERRENFSNESRGYRVVDFETAKRNGEPFDAMLKYYADYRERIKGEPPVLPNVTQRMCTANLKIKTNERFMRFGCGFNDYAAAVGIRYDEPRRYAKMHVEGSRYVMPLFEDKITKQDVMAFWRSQPFDLDLDPESDEGNCRLCFLKRRDKLIKIIRKDTAANGGDIPEHVQRWIDRENKAKTVFRTSREPYEKLVKIAMSTEEIIVDESEQVVDCICGEA